MTVSALWKLLHLQRICYTYVADLHGPSVFSAALAEWKVLRDAPWHTDESLQSLQAAVVRQASPLPAPARLAGRRKGECFLAMQGPL